MDSKEREMVHIEQFGGRRFNSYSRYFRRMFGERVQKVAIDAGFTCPNRDNTVGKGGCTFCLNDAFSPSYCNPKLSVAEQIDLGIEFHSRRYAKVEKFLAYFQSFSNTYKPLDELREIYSAALANQQIIGLVIGTRPDCVDEAKLDYFAELAQEKYLIIEYGVESVYDDILRRVNRGHDFASAERAIEMTAERGIKSGAHFIIGLPGETKQMAIDSIDKINRLQIDTIKFHQLQIFKGTAMEKDFAEHPDDYHLFELEEYVDLFIDLLERLRPDIVLERFAGEAPPRYHVNSSWGRVRNERLMQIFENRLAERNTYQGRLFNPLQASFENRF